MNRTARWVTAGLVGVCLVAAGCSKSGTRGGQGDAVKPLPSKAVIAADRSRIRDGGTLHIAVIDYPQNFNSAHIDGNDVGLKPVAESTTPYFFTIDDKGDPVLNTDYATSVKVTSRHPFVVTYELNPKAVWSDGTPIGVADFLGMWKADNGRNPGYQLASSNGFEKITKIARGSSEREVKVTYSEPYAAWPTNFNKLLPASLTRSPAAYNKSWKDKPLLSGGPFLVTRTDPTAQTITEKPNPRWWGVTPKLDQIVIRALALDTQPRAFANGELDALQIATNADALKQAEHTSGTKILRAGSLTWYHVDLNGKTPLLKDPKMRQAIARGIDREQIARARLTPVGAPATILGNHLYAATQDGYQDNATPAVGYDPKKAGAMLDSLGWKRDGDVRSKNGKKLSLRMVVQAGNDRQEQVAEQVQNSLADIGVKVVIADVPKDDFFTKAVNVGAYDLVYFGWDGSPFPECDNKSIFYPGLSPQNHTFVSSAAVGKGFDAACSELDPAKRRALGNAVDKELFGLSSLLTLYSDPAIGAVKDDLANYDEDSSAFQIPVWQDVGFLK